MLATIQLALAERRFRQQRVLLSLQTLSWPGIEGETSEFLEERKFSMEQSVLGSHPPLLSSARHSLYLLYMSW